MWGRRKAPNRVHQLVTLAKEVFDGGGIPSEPDIQRIREALSALLFLSPHPAPLPLERPLPQAHSVPRSGVA